MRVLIVEDEKSAVDNLKYLLKEVKPTIIIENVIDNVVDSIEYLKSNPPVELVFMDIHLADGVSFEIFDRTEVKIPIIFTTAYDQYAIQAFKVHSIDYLLKPLEVDDLQLAMQKFENMRSPQNSHLIIKEMIKDVMPSRKMYKHTYLVQQRDRLIPINVKDVAYFVIEASILKAYIFSGKGYVIDKKLEEIELELDPKYFFRASRQIIVQRQAIESMQVYFQGKLLLHVKPPVDYQIILSKAKSRQLRSWMNELS
jgi:two-component system LytT family response regulator